MKLKAVWSMSKAFTKAFFRNKLALFFTFLFPLVFLIVFGFIFGGDNHLSFKIGLINKSSTDTAERLQVILSENPVFEFENKDLNLPLEELKIQLGRDQIDAIIVLPQDFGSNLKTDYPQGELQLFYNQSEEQLNQIITTTLEGIFEDLNQAILPIEHPLKIVSQPLQTADLDRFDYIFAGLIGFTILSLGVFGMSEGFLQDKKSKALLRIRLAPIRAWQVILATIFNRVLVGLISIALMFLAGILIFDFNMRGDYFSFLGFSVISLICLLGLGAAIAGWAQNNHQAAPLTNLASFPMMFLSGVFFPVFLMPEWLQAISAFLPLTAINDGLRLILTEGFTLLNLGPQILIIFIWTISLYILAAKVFRWE